MKFFICNPNKYKKNSSNMRNGLSESEAGKLGAIAAKKILAERKLKAILLYNENPCKCILCNSDLSYEKQHNKFCSKSCAATYNNKLRKHNTEQRNRNISIGLQKYYMSIGKEVKEKEIKKSKQCTTKIPKIKYCTHCGAEKGKCKHPEICKKHLLFKTLSIFGFDLNTIGTEQIFDEYLKTKNTIENFYILTGATNDILKETFGYSSGAANFHKILKSLGIKTRNFSESLKFAILNNHRPVCTNNTEHSMFMGCQQGWHITWNNKNVYLRSSYEYEYAKHLDDFKIDYYVEDLRIEYFDTKRNSYHIAVPDFYLPETNTIVEIKSTFTLDVQNMKDKVKTYKELGYNFKLILEHKEEDINKL